MGQGSLSSEEYSSRRFIYIAGRIPNPGKRILIVGFGHPHELKAASLHGFEVVGVDRDVVATTNARNQHFEVIRTDVESGLPFQALSFDVLICHHVIEHMRNPSRFFSEVARILVDGGFFVVETPDVNYNSHFHNDPTHVTPFTKSSLEACVTGDFRIVKSQILCPIWLLWKWSNVGFLLPNIVNLSDASVLVIAQKKTMP